MIIDFKNWIQHLSIQAFKRVPFIRFFGPKLIYQEAQVKYKKKSATCVALLTN